MVMRTNIQSKRAMITGNEAYTCESDVFFLGRKDTQQAAIIHKIIHDLHIDVS